MDRPIHSGQGWWDGHAYQIGIPKRTQLHNAIHISLLKPLTVPSSSHITTGIPVLSKSNVSGIDNKRILCLPLRSLLIRIASKSFSARGYLVNNREIEVLREYRAFHDKYPRKLQTHRLQKLLMNLN